MQLWNRIQALNSFKSNCFNYLQLISFITRINSSVFRVYVVSFFFLLHLYNNKNIMLNITHKIIM